MSFEKTNDKTTESSRSLMEAEIKVIASSLPYDIIPCPCNQGTSWRTKGVAGAVNSRGYRDLGLVCNSCKQSKQLPALIKMHLSNPAVQLVSEKISEAESRILHGQKAGTITDFFFGTSKRPRTESPIVFGEAAVSYTAGESMESEIVRLRKEAEEHRLVKQQQADLIEKLQASNLKQMELIQTLMEKIDALTTKVDKLADKPVRRGEVILNDTAPEKLAAPQSVSEQDEVKSSGDETVTGNTESRDKLSYSQVASKKPAKRYGPNQSISERNLKSMAAAALAPSKEPVKFAKLCFKIRASSMARATKERVGQPMLWRMLNILGIRRDVFHVSKIGNSLVEIIFPAPTEPKIRDALSKKAVEIVDLFTTLPPSSGRDVGQIQSCTVNRLGRMLAKARLPMVRKCILEGHPAEIQRLAEALALSITNVNGGENRTESMDQDIQL